MLWFDDHFERRNCTSLERPLVGEAAITGTDASDWGTGQLVWLDGAREEVVLKFTSVEKGRSINWRELLGVLRVLEFFGDRLRGRLVLIETDNMAAKGAASKFSSKSGDMQELVRRLLECAEKHEMQVRFTHTPGVKLIRPDQTSRGDPVEEPRARLAAGQYNLLSERFGPFTEMLGAEREHRAEGVVNAVEKPRIWMHPTYNTVGSALRLLGERMGRGDGASGVVVVPDDSTASWWGLTKHFNVVGRFGVGDTGLELRRMGAWRAQAFARKALILTFPRAAGSVARPIWCTAPALDLGDGYVKNAEGTARALPLPAGSFVYSGGLTPGEHGNLYMVWRQFSPRRDDGVYHSEGSDVRCVLVAELNRSYTLSGRTKKKVWDVVGGKLVYALDISRAGKSFAPGVGYTPWMPRADMLWSVDHLIKEMPTHDAESPRSGGRSMSAKVEAYRRFTFDFKQAEREVAHGHALQVDAEAACHPFSLEGAESPAVDDACLPPVGESILTHTRRTSLAAEVQRSPDRLERRIRAAKRAEDARAMDSLCEAVEEIDVVGAAEAELAGAVESAAEAAAARVHVPPPKATTREFVPEKRLPSTVGGEGQRNRYAGTKCAGCGFQITVGDLMVPGGRAMCHKSAACVALAERTLTEAVLQSQAASKPREQQDAASEKREAQLKHRFSNARQQIIRSCVEGKCRSTEARVFCSEGCGRGAHLTTCFQLSSHRAKLGAFKCGECRASEMSPHSCTPIDSLVKEGGLNSLLELATGAEGTAANQSEFARLERLWLGLRACEAGVDLTAFVLPRHSEESFISFLRWLVTDGGRARSFHTIFRSAAGVFAKLHNLTTSPSRDE